MSFPDELFDRLAQGFGVGVPGQRLLDLATGTGSLARGFARRGCQVEALDQAPEQLEAARALDAELGVEGVRYHLASAEATGLPGGRFDGVSVGQAWHWLDRERAAAEARRLLRPGGWLVLAHFDWIPLPGNAAQATEALIAAHNPGWVFAGGHGIHPWWAADLSGAGFRALETFSFDQEVPYSHAAWRGRIRASAGVGATLSPDQVRVFDRALQALLAQDFPGDPLAVLHRTFVMIGRHHGG